MTDKIIMYDSPEAAHYVTDLKGWVNSKGQYCGDKSDSEHLARWSGCTHEVCECGEPRTKHWLKCDSCREKKAIGKYNSLDAKEWNGEGMIYSEVYDKYFSDIQSAEEYTEEIECKLSDLRLLICEPQYLHPIQDDYWLDDLPEDGDISGTIKKALDEFNEILKAEGPVSYVPGKYRVEIK